MILDDQITPARVAKLGRDVVVVTAPGHVRIQSTGPGAKVILDDGPATGKQWTATVHMEIVETDVP